MSKTQSIIESMQNYQNGDSYSEPCDVNHPIRRFFRCWLDGSYNGEEHYRQNLAYIKAYKDNNKKLRSFVIGQFVAYMSRENDCSYATVQKAITKALTKKQLEILNQELIEDALDLIEGEE